MATQSIRLGASEVYLLGGESAIQPIAVIGLRVIPTVKSVIRISGADRYATAEAVANRVLGILGPEYEGGAFVATGANFPDALAAAPISASSCTPLLLADPRTGMSTSAMNILKKSDHVVILGAGGAVPASTQSQISRGLGAGVEVERLSGSNRYATAAQVAAYGVSDCGLEWDGVGLCNGTRYPDALSGGVVQGVEGSVMLLTEGGTLSPETQSILQARSGSIGTISFYGGPSAIGPSVRTVARNIVAQ